MSFVGAVHLDPEGRRGSWRRRALLIIAAVGVVIVAVTAALVLLPSRTSAAVTASSSGEGSDLAQLASGSTDRIAWRSAGASAVGTWVQLAWTTPERLDHIRVDAAGERTYDAARVTFSDGSALMVTPDAKGVVDVSFPERQATWARLTIAEGASGSSEVALSRLRLDDDGSAISSTTAALHASTSSNAAGSSASALLDGEPSKGVLGSEWIAAPDSGTAEATIAWTGPRPVSSVRLWGPSASAYDPAYSAAAALNGSIRFSDGSTVRVSGISGGSGQPTTVAFTPRMVTSATVLLERTIPQATIGLRAVQIGDTAHPIAQTEPTGDVAALVPDPASCDASTASVGVPTDGTISLICPQVGAQVGTSATIRVRATPGTALTASTDLGTSSGPVAAAVTSDRPRNLLASAVAGADGTATLTFSTATLPRGPLGLVVRGTGSTLRPLHVQLLNAGGVQEAAPYVRHRGSDLVWDEEFDGPVSASWTDAGSTYGALKPEYWGGSQFGDAVFDSPTSGLGTFALADGSLRIRAQPIGAGTDPTGNDRQFTGGLLSSLRVGATGFSAQYGYFEARMMAPAGDGTWPAFWTMDSDAATRESIERSTEVDAVELYGNRTRQTCHSTHNYTGTTDRGAVRCIQSAIDTDWAAGWHVYGVQIEPGRAQFYVDGRLVMTQTGLTATEKPFYFMANLALGGGWPVDLAAAGNRADLWIDWIRVYV